MEKKYNIQQVANILGIYKGTIVNYERKHVFPKPHRNPINNYREYFPDDVNKLKRILQKGH